MSSAQTRRRDSTFAHRDRAAVLWGLAFVIGSQLALVCGMAHWWPTLRDPEYGRKLASLRLRLAENPGRPLVLLMGSSRVGVNIRPDRLPEWPAAQGSRPVVFNFALCRSDPVMDRLCLRRLLADGIRPDWLLLEVSPELFNRLPGSCPLGDSIDPRRLEWQDVRLLSRYHSQARKLYREWIESRLLPTYALRFLLLSEYARPALPPALQRLDYDWAGLDGWGWLRIPEMEENGDSSAWRLRLNIVHRSYAAGFERYCPHDCSTRALRDFLDVCRREKIAVVLMRMPDPFRKYYSPAAGAAMSGFVQEVSEQYGVPVIDMGDWMSDESFYDGVHLFHGSAASFTGRFGREVLQPILAGQPFKR